MEGRIHDVELKMEANVNHRYLGLDHYFVLLEGIFKYKFYFITYFLMHETVSEAKSIAFDNSTDSMSKIDKGQK